MTDRKSTTIAIRSDRAYIAAINQLASERGTTAADMVYDAMEAAYGEELAPLASFFRSRDYENSQIAKVAVNE